MKTFNLRVHQKHFTDKQADEVLLSPKEFSQITVGDVVEIYHPEEEYSRLLLQITSLPEDFQQKGTVSIEQSIATAFQLRAFKDVHVNKVNIKNVTLDLVELLFRDQYLSRSDMSRMRNSMINTCVYLNKKIEVSDMRTQVNELWSKGDRVTCGVISEDTRIVFRSSTAVVQIFIQMSTEMWDFDINGDLYFEKAVNGFLTDLFAKWKEQSCCHDVTIVMFSRTFYEAQSRDEFPAHMQECLQQDYQGRFYEDFYRIVIQNERYEEWMKTLKQLRKLFNEYDTRVLNYHRRPGCRTPKAYNSTAAQGNFLETLNMTLNLFEQYYMDRNFDRTGKVAVVITPGAGVFEVDRELTNITKQRTIDCGVGSDLVCMGEQPLHAAPLFKFHSKNYHNTLEVGDDYNIPHWMNHSFYTSKNQVQFYSNKSFVPRIKIPPEILEQLKHKTVEPEQDLSYEEEEDNFPFVDYDEYDAQVFKLPTRNAPQLGLGRSSRGKENREPKRHPQTFMEAKLGHRPRTRHTSDNISQLPVEKLDKKPALGVSPAVSIMSKSSSGGDLSASLGCYTTAGKDRQSTVSTDSDFEPYHYVRSVIGSAGSPVGHSKKYLHKYKQRRALINPFAPSRMQFKMTSNRRRWVHAFPTDPQGVAVQTHHVHTYSYTDNEEVDDTSTHQPTREVIEAAQLAVQLRKERGNSRKFDDSSSDISGGEDLGDNSSYKSPSHQDTGGRGSHKVQQQKSWMWGPTGEQEWSPDLTTGVDWKSLTIPASLPITTDYLPETFSLRNDYVVSDYNLLPDDVNSDYYTNPPVTEDEKYFRKQPLTTQEVFKELISQRLAQGFQLICVLPGRRQSTYVLGGSSSSQLTAMSSSPQVPHMMGLMRARPREEQSEEVFLSIGRIFHKITLTGPTITVTRYRPRHPNAQMYYSYKYRFQAPDSYNYDVSWSEFYNEKLENYNWNYLDQYICTRGEGDFGLMESLKFWRSRFFLLPCNNPATKKIIEGNPRCDIYEEKTSQELKQLIMGFTRYLETLNKIRRTQTTRQQKTKSQEADGGQDEESLTLASPLLKIADAMLDSHTGVPMLPKQHGLPPQCFISAEAVEWCVHHIKGVTTVRSAIALLQRVLDEGHICHASGSHKHKFMYGFYIYCFVPREKGKAEPLSYNPLFQNDWCEVAVLPLKEENENVDQVSFNLDHSPKYQTGVYLSESLEDWKQRTGLDKNGQTWAQQSATQLHKYVNVEVDPTGRSERPEWATARYHAHYSPQCSFELQVQWMVSTGGILGDLIYNWARKAGACGFHLLPVPTDPFALPTAPDSDPLRGPIFIPLNTLCIDSSHGGELFYGHDEESRSQKLLHLQETIINRYGFMPTNVCIPNKSSYMYSQYEEYQQYVHCTGGMFILIEQSHCSKSPLVKSPVVKSPIPKERYFGSLGKKSSSELRKDYIARQASHTLSQSTLESESKIGFLWSWNYMSSKRWRSGNTGDEHFQDKVLRDFRAFCSNEENRLKEFWDDYHQIYS